MLYIYVTHKSNCTVLKIMKFLCTYIKLNVKNEFRTFRVQVLLIEMHTDLKTHLYA